MSESPFFNPPSREATPSSDDEEDQSVFPSAERVREHGFFGPHPQMIGQLPPGGIDWELVNECQARPKVDPFLPVEYWGLAERLGLGG